MLDNKFHVGQQLKNSPFDDAPSFVIVRITESIVSGNKYYYCKDINGNRVQKTTEEFLYPM